MVEAEGDKWLYA